MSKKAYELTEDEWQLVLGYRAGEISLSPDGIRIWIDISELELRAIHLWRRVCFGTVTFEIKNSIPIAFKADICGHLDKPVIESQMELLALKPVHD